MRKIQWIVQDKAGQVKGIFPTRKKALSFFDEEDHTITKFVWNGFYHSETPIDYDPYQTAEVKLYAPMF